MEKLTPSFKEVVRNLHFLPCIAEAFFKEHYPHTKFRAREQAVQENLQSFSGTACF